MSEADSSARTRPWAAPTVHVQTTHHDCLVAHIELGLSGDQGLLVLPDDRGDPAKGIQVLDAGNAAGKRHQVTRWGKGRESLVAHSGRPGCGETKGTALLQVPPSGNLPGRQAGAVVPTLSCLPSLRDGHPGNCPINEGSGRARDRGQWPQLFNLLLSWKPGSAAQNRGALSSLRVSFNPLAQTPFSWGNWSCLTGLSPRGSWALSVLLCWLHSSRQLVSPGSCVTASGATPGRPRAQPCTLPGQAAAPRVLPRALSPKSPHASHVVSPLGEPGIHAGPSAWASDLDSDGGVSWGHSGRCVPWDLEFQGTPSGQLTASKGQGSLLLPPSNRHLYWKSRISLSLSHTPTHTHTQSAIQGGAQMMSLLIPDLEAHTTHL